MILALSSLSVEAKWFESSVELTTNEHPGLILQANQEYVKRGC